MDDLFEILVELLLDGSNELLRSKKVPNWIRYIIALVFSSIIIGILIIGIILIKDSITGGIIIIGIGLFMLIGIIIKIRKYLRN